MRVQQTKKMNTSWNGPSTRAMIRRLQDEQARLQDQTDVSFLYVRQDMTDVQNRINSLERQVEELKGRPVPVARAPVRCRICGESGHMANNSKFHPLMMPIVRATNPVQTQNPVIMSSTNIQR